ncbi:hypothetical protein D0864_00247 [Hortaea werneckii]|uniref:Histidine-specific methyltransferase SAM-dependent domain-containing protein n=1 Tax=Hortaea werneckii TaxID=91943 RepID=A0A3M7HLZ5_HORWE|nr:hypothetical protein D0864_00247 [Hortaea werneckii]
MGSIGQPSSEAVASKASVPSIIDIRSDTAGIELKQEILTGLKPADGGEKTLPTLLLYDEEGLKLFERITYLKEYYLTGEEIAVLERHAESIAQRIPDGSMVVELGSGNLRKIQILLDALERSGKNVSYYALDLMEPELERTLAEVPQYQHVKCNGLLGTYDDGLAWLRNSENVNRPKSILSMGSSIGNFTRDEAAGFLRQFAAILGPRDNLMIGVDGCEDPQKVYRAYNDSEGVTHEFTANGLKHANRLLGYKAFELDDWEAVGDFDAKSGRHQAFVVPKKDINVEGVAMKQGEKIRIEESYKYSRPQAQELWRSANVMEVAAWSNDAGDYALHMLKPITMFATKPEEYAAHPVPSLDEWHQLWSTWDMVTRQMIPDEQLLDKPIKLRNACVFYLGHIPTFFDMKLTEATGGKPTEPKYFYNIFERGIDPDVDNPEQVHSHSEIPDEWPKLDEIMAFQKRVRQRVKNIYASGQAYEDKWTGRALWLGLEHEIMHLETLLYMLLQSEWALPPPTAAKPDFAQIAADAQKNAVENEWFDVPEQTIAVGLDDPDSPEGPVRHFGWDVEKPPRKTHVAAMKAKGRPITNGEYAKYVFATGKKDLPASWLPLDASNGVNGVNGVTNGGESEQQFIRDKAVRTIYGPVPLEYALDWPVSASYDELNGCAQYMGGRIPTLEEARSIYYYVDALKQREPSKTLGRTIPAVNGHLVNDGVQESPPSNPSLNGSGAVASSNSNDVFVNLDAANVGFKHWHPMPVTPYGNKLAGQGEMGGLWEWTSSALEMQDGFKPMKLYPAYSADFYDGKHNVVLGGSWSTHPRVAGRKTFVNWYQRNYPYVWAGARMVKDA